MNETPSRVRRMPKLPLPRGPEHQAWIIDLTPPAWVQKVWPGGAEPYRYTPAGQILRMAMPMRGFQRYPALLAGVTDRVKRLRLCGDLPATFHGADDWTDEMRATVVIATALAGKGTTFVVVNIQPSGRVVFFHRMKLTKSWHPDAPTPGGEQEGRS